MCVVGGSELLPVLLCLYNRCSSIKGTPKERREKTSRDHLPVLSTISTTVEEGSPIVTLESLVSVSVTLKLSLDSEMLSEMVGKLAHTL